MKDLLVYASTGCREGVCQSTNLDPGVITTLLAFLGTFIVFIIIFILLSLALWIWALVDTLRRSEAEFKKIGNGEKNLWIILLIVSIFFGFYLIVSIIYYFVIYRAGKSKKEVTKAR